MNRELLHDMEDLPWECLVMQNQTSANLKLNYVDQIVQNLMNWNNQNIALECTAVISKWTPDDGRIVIYELRAEDSRQFFLSHSVVTNISQCIFMWSTYTFFLYCF